MNATPYSPRDCRSRVNATPGRDLPIAERLVPTVGIWMEMTDAALADSHGEGLVRWARAFIRGVDRLAEVKRIVIPCSHSAQPIVERLFSEACIDDDSFALISKKLVIAPLTSGDSLWSRLRVWADRKRKRAKERLESLQVTANPLSWPGSLLTLAKESPSSLGLILLSVSRLTKILTATLSLGLTGAVRPLIRRLRSPSESLAEAANRAYPEISWVIPNPGWAASSQLAGRKIVNIADIVYREFPLPGVSAAELEQHAESLVRNAEAADKIVCFSEHVAQRHIRTTLPAEASKTVVIPHAPFPSVRPALTPAESRRKLGDALRHHFSTLLPNRHYCDFPFEDVDYLFVSSKCRPYKNYAAILEAYEHVLRRSRRNVKLIVTAHLSGNAELASLLHHRGLVFDVAEATNVPDEVHTLLIQNARMLIIPTLFEGGMPFGFCEAVGLGTPCVLSRIPVVEETLTRDELTSPEYFDATDTAAMTQAILHVLDNRQSVLERQEAIRQRLMARTWQDVAAEYLAPIEWHQPRTPEFGPSAMASRTETRTARTTTVLS